MADLEDLRSAQAELFAAITGPSAPEGRGAVYRRLVRAGLRTILKFQLPRTSARRGPSFEGDLDRFFEGALPRSPYLRDTAAAFVAFIAPIWGADAVVPRYLIDLARHEQTAFDVANAPDDVDPREKPELTLDRGVRLTTSATVRRYAHAIHLLSDDPDDRELPREAPTTLFAYRDRGHDVRYLVLTPAAADLIERLLSGATLGDAVKGAAALEGGLSDAFFRKTSAFLEDLQERGVLV